MGLGDPIYHTLWEQPKQTKTRRDRGCQTPPPGPLGSHRDETLLFQHVARRQGKEGPPERQRAHGLSAEQNLAQVAQRGREQDARATGSPGTNRAGMDSSWAPRRVPVTPAHLLPAPHTARNPRTRPPQSCSSRENTPRFRAVLFNGSHRAKRPAPKPVFFNDVRSPPSNRPAQIPAQSPSPHAWPPGLPWASLTVSTRLGVVARRRLSWQPREAWLLQGRAAFLVWLL